MARDLTVWQMAEEAWTILHGCTDYERRVDELLRAIAGIYREGRPFDPVDLTVAERELLCELLGAHLVEHGVSLRAQGIDADDLLERLSPVG